MTSDEIARIRQRIAEVGATIQPHLHPHSALAKRNAFAHLWLGIRTRFGENWRGVAIAGEVETFVDWIGENPNAQYEEFTGPTTQFFSDAESSSTRVASAEPTLFD